MNYAESTLIKPAPDPGVRDLAPIFLDVPSKILDIGTGNGRNAIFLASRGHQVIAIDENEKYIHRAMQNSQADRQFPDIEFVTADMRDLSSMDEDFDAVFMNRVFQELNDKEEAESVVRQAQSKTIAGGYNFVTAYIGTRSDQRKLPHLVIHTPGEVEKLYLENDMELLHRKQELHPLRFEHSIGKLICQSYTEFVAQKPE